jgi:hypothetical protein
MARTIWKSSGRIADFISIIVPVDARIISARVTPGTIGQFDIWYEHDTVNTGNSQRNFACFGTGHSIPSGDIALQFISTLWVDSMGLVFHLYEVL